MTVTDDQQNSSWNGIWQVKTARFDHGWTVEVAIPFKMLRYRGSGPQTWGINLRRLVKWKNEILARTSNRRSGMSGVPISAARLVWRASARARRTARIYGS